jgi:S1-C subfamily serine protease
MKKAILWSVLSVVVVIALGLACGGVDTPVPTPTPTQNPVEAASQYTVFIKARFPGDREGSGTGIIFNEDGWIVTNAHVVEGASIIRVQVPDRGELSAELAGVSPCDDLAVIKVPGAGFPVAQFSDSNDLKLGEDVMVVGYPLGRSDLSVTRGIVSKLNVNADQLQSLIQTDASVNPGNSGGPLLDMRGGVVGIITLKMQYDQAGNPIEGTAFAISSNLTDKVIPELAQGKNRNWIGLNAIPLNNIKSGMNGLWIIAVADNSPADRAGLAVGDVLLTMQGVSVNSMADLCDVIRATKDTDRLSFEVIPFEEIIAERTPTPPSKPTAPPTPELTLAFGDDFSDLTCNWETLTVFADMDVEMECSQNRFRFKVNEVGYMPFSLPSNRKSYTDFLLQVHIEQAEGPESLQGVIFRYQDAKNFYLFAIRGDGHYAIFKNEDDDYETLVTWTSSDQINLGSGGNWLIVAAVGSRIRVFINDEAVDEIIDDSFPTGEIGLTVGSFQEEVGAPVVYFDNVEVWEYKP